MASFAPQAIMLFACINRRVYMGNGHADREFDYYREQRSQLRCCALNCSSPGKLRVPC